jgi:alginate O-acetyltransferase complex protein AlgI
MSIIASFLDVKFLLLLLILGSLRYFVPSRHFTLAGAFGSAAVVGLTAPKTFAAITVITLGFLFPLHRIACWAREHNRSGWFSKSLLPGGVGLLVTLLVLSKSYRHFSLPFMEREDLAAGLISLVGFSYFIFRAISFLHVQSILRFKEATPWGLLFYTLFPPTLTSGPIQKYQDFRQQLASPTPLSGSLLTAVAYRLTLGYFKKVVVAFFLNEWVTQLLTISAPNVYVSVLTIAVLYLYFYFDFAGYSDIAIALGLLLGIKVPENFRKPFTATTISEFWRNWHITLVDWFRDHVFIPLGGMQGSRRRAGALAFLIMVLCGLWHGLTLNFLLWGVFHGLALWVEAISGSKPIPPALRRGPKFWWRVIWTNSRVALAGILFLPDNEAILRVLGGLINFAST